MLGGGWEEGMRRWKTEKKGVGKGVLKKQLSNSGDKFEKHRDKKRSRDDESLNYNLAVQSSVVECK